MAGVLDALARHVMKMISAMGEAEIRMLLGVSDDIKQLEAKVEPLQNFLTDAERRRITDKSVQAWVSKLKDALYKAVDILDLCQIEAMDQQEENTGSGSDSSGGSLCSLEGLLREKLPFPFVGCLTDILHPFLFCVQNPGFAHQVGGRIRKLNDELDNISNGAAKYKFNIDLAPYDYEEGSRPSTGWADLGLGGEDPLYIESDLVGDQIKEKAEELVQELIVDHSCSSSSDVKMVAIVGLGGIGKSTLAKKAFASEAIDKEFKPKIWLSVTQQFTKVDLLKDAITQAGGNHGKEKNETILILRQALTEALSKRKFLLVLDDVWSHEAWENVLREPLLKACQPGSRVLVTSRKRKVVERMGASSIRRVEKLGDEDAWCLLKKQLPQTQVGVARDFVELETIGKKIVKKCDGLPLAIKVMGGLLRTREPKERDWNDVLEKDLGWNEDGSQKELNYSVSLSYDDLTPELKQCFLFYSLFPKGSGFIEDRVISMWISEGLIKHDGSSGSGQLNLEEIGAKYHRELFARNLLERDDSTENTWDYTLHDVVRSFAKFMAKEEAFVVHKDKANIRNLLPENQKFRRISIFASKLDLTMIENQETLRTLLIDCNIKPGGSLASFASLRVLDISSEKTDWLVDSLCMLRHLRYLSFSDTNISRLPGDIHKMRFLQHIQLDNCKMLDKLPDSITKLACLRYLSLTGSNVDVIPKGFGGLTNLITLYGFPVKTDGAWCTLEELGDLSHLKSLIVQSLENVPDRSVAERAKISNKKRLEYLELNCYKDDDDDEEDDEDDDEDVEDDNDDEDDDEDEDEDVDDDSDDDGDGEDEDGQMEDAQIEEEEENEEGNGIEEEETGKEVRQIGVEQQERIEAVFDELCPPPVLETLIIQRYFGRRLPNWLQFPQEKPFTRLMNINLLHLTFCIRLPDGLCRIRSLEELLVEQAPAIEHVGPDFQSMADGDGAVAFPKLRSLELRRLSGWKEWEWEEEVEEEEQGKDPAMPALVFLRIRDCLVTHLPPGLASDRRRNLRTIYLEELTLLEFVENFPSVVTLHVHNCPELKRISRLAKLRMVCIEGCPKLKRLEGVPALDRMDLDDEPWEVTGPDARRTPKRQNQVTSEAVGQLLQNLVITRQAAVSSPKS